MSFFVQGEDYTFEEKMYKSYFDKGASPCIAPPSSIFPARTVLTLSRWGFQTPQEYTGRHYGGWNYYGHRQLLLEPQLWPICFRGYTLWTNSELAKAISYRSTYRPPPKWELTKREKFRRSCLWVFSGSIWVFGVLIVLFLMIGVPMIVNRGKGSDNSTSSTSSYNWDTDPDPFEFDPPTIPDYDGDGIPGEKRKRIRKDVALIWL
jgi:hypothetical protein